MIKLSHIVNPVNAQAGSELHRIQPITWETIRRAKDFAKDDVDANIFSVSYAEDRVAVPDYFTKLDDLQRSVLDLASFDKKKKLPLIADILGSLYQHTDSDWLIYTNADICLMPQFYMAVADMISEGHDAILITRRRISKGYSIDQLPQMYSDMGGSHPGYDCFVFHRSLLQKFILDDICIGVPFLEVSLLHNFIAFASNLKHVDDLHLTFHLGMEVMPPIDREYYQYNRNIYETKIFPTLKPLLDLKKFPYSGRPMPERIMKWGLNPCYRTAMMLELEGKDFRRRLKIKLDEWRWRLLSRTWQ